MRIKKASKGVKFVLRHYLTILSILFLLVPPSSLRAQTLSTTDITTTTTTTKKSTPFLKFEPKKTKGVISPQIIKKKETAIQKLDSTRITITPTNQITTTPIDSISPVNISPIIDVIVDDLPVVPVTDKNIRVHPIGKGKAIIYMQDFSDVKRGQ